MEIEYFLNNKWYKIKSIFEIPKNAEKIKVNDLIISDFKYFTFYTVFNHFLYEGKDKLIDYVIIYIDKFDNLHYITSKQKVKLHGIARNL